MKTEEDLKKIIEHLQLPFEISPLQFLDAMTAYHDGRFALFYDVGGGKTLVSTLIAMLFDYPTVVCVPHILIPQWERWLKRARVPDNQVGVYYGPKRDINLLKTRKWILTSHAIFRKDAIKIRDAYRGRVATLLLDEAQIIKSVKSKIFQATKFFIGADRPFVPMTATPTAKPEDTYAYMKLKTPDAYRNFKHWEAMHVKSRDFFGAIEEYCNLDLLRDNFALKSAKRDKVELFGYDLKPDIQPIIYDLDPKHRKLYEKLVKEQLLELPDGGKIDATTSQKLRHMMQQIVWNPAHFSGDPEMKPAGLELLELECNELDFMDKSRSKYVIWTYYKSTTEAIYAWLKERYGNSGALAYGGSNSAKAVHDIMFNDDCRWGVFNPMSVGAGLELQHVCNQMAFAEMVTTPIPNRQAIGRVDRPGQKVKPTIRILQASDTVQVSLFQDLLRNDEQAVYVERTRTSLAQDLFGRNKG